MAAVVTRKEQATQSRAKLVRIAQQLFIAQGYDATPVSQILAEAGMARGALYHYFPNGKEQLFEAVIDEVDGALHDGFNQVVESNASPLNQILAGFEVLMRLATDRVFARIILIEAAGVFPGAWQSGSEYVLLRDALARAVDAGELRPLPLEAAAATIYGAARRAADLVARADDPETVARECSDVLRMMLDGMRA